MATDDRSEQLLDLLRAVHEALNVPHAATVGDEKIHDRILLERARLAKVALRLFDAGGDIPTSAQWLRDETAQRPAVGYKTWDEAMGELGRR